MLTIVLQTLKLLRFSIITLLLLCCAIIMGFYIIILCFTITILLLYNTFSRRSIDKISVEIFRYRSVEMDFLSKVHVEHHSNIKK